jgi:hypothetical protein
MPCSCTPLTRSYCDYTRSVRRHDASPQRASDASQHPNHIPPKSRRRNAVARRPVSIVAAAEISPRISRNASDAFAELMSLTPFSRHESTNCLMKMAESQKLAGRQGFEPIRDEHASRDMPEDAPSCQRASDSGKSERSWLGGRDSNPDNVVQSHVSYR